MSAGAAREKPCVLGVASKSKVMCLRVGDEEGFLLSRQLQAIDYVIQMKAKVSLHPYVLKEQVAKSSFSSNFKRRRLTKVLTSV